MKHKNIKVVSIDTENMLYTCDDGNEYPLMDGLETLSIEELQKHIDSAKQATLDIIEKQKTKMDKLLIFIIVVLFLMIRVVKETTIDYIKIF